MRWSYKTVHFSLKKDGLLGNAFLDEAEIEVTLNDYGKSGWELVSFMEVNDGLIAVFKQPFGHGIPDLEEEDDVQEETPVREKIVETPDTPDTAAIETKPSFISPQEKEEVETTLEKKIDEKEGSDVGTIRIF